MDELKFTAYYIKDDKVIAAASMGRSTHTLVIQEAMRLNVMASGEDIKSGKEDLTSIKKRVLEKRGSSKCQRENCCKKKATVN